LQAACPEALTLSIIEIGTKFVGLIQAPQTTPQELARMFTSQEDPLRLAYMVASLMSLDAVKDNDDRSLALKAVAEGDATLAGFAYAMGRMDTDISNTLVGGLQSRGSFGYSLFQIGVELADFFLGSFALGHFSFKLPDGTFDFGVERIVLVNTAHLGGQYLRQTFVFVVELRGADLVCQADPAVHAVRRNDGRAQERVDGGMLDREADGLRIAGKAGKAARLAF